MKTKKKVLLGLIVCAISFGQVVGCGVSETEVDDINAEAEADSEMNELVMGKVAIVGESVDSVAKNVTKVYNDKAELDLQKAEEEAKLEEERLEKEKKEKEQAEKEAAKPKHIPGIICWGDSLTFGYKGGGVSYPGALQELLNQSGYSDVKVVNVGSPGEDSISIAARSGGIPLSFSYDVTIQGGPDDFNIVGINAMGRGVNLAIAENVGINPCTVNGVEGVLWNAVAGTNEVDYRFKRTALAEPMAVTAGTRIVPYYASHCRDYVSIVFIGTNGGYGDYADLINQQNAIINSRTANTGKYLIIGMFNPPGGYEDTMRATYGDHFLSFPAYCGGSIPGEYWSDDIHLNGTGYAALGQAVFERLVQLGSLDR